MPGNGRGRPQSAWWSHFEMVEGDIFKDVDDWLDMSYAVFKDIEHGSWVDLRLFNAGPSQFALYLV